MDKRKQTPLQPIQYQMLTHLVEGRANYEDVNALTLRALKRAGMVDIVGTHITITPQGLQAIKSQAVLAVNVKCCICHTEVKASRAGPYYPIGTHGGWSYGLRICKTCVGVGWRFQTDGAVNLDTGEVFRLKQLKNRVKQR